MGRILFVVLFLMFFFANAQDKGIAYGVRGGFNYSGLSNFDPEDKPGFHAGTYFKIPVSERVWLQPELMFSQKGSSTGLADDKIFYNSFLDSHYRRRKLALHYVDLIAAARYDITGGLHVLAGPGVSVLASYYYKFNDGPGSRDFYDFPDRDIRRFDFVLHGGAGYEFKNGLMLGIRGERGLLSVFEDQENIQNYLIQVAAGFTVSGPRRFKKNTLTEQEELLLELEEAGMVE